MVALPAGGGEGDIIVGAAGSVHSCPGLEQQLSNLRRESMEGMSTHNSYCTHTQVSQSVWVTLNTSTCLYNVCVCVRVQP